MGCSTFFQRLVNIKNFPYIVAIVGGFLGIFGIPQNISGLGELDIIILLIVFIISSSLFSKITYLQDIDERTKEMQINLTGVDDYFVITGKDKKHSIPELFEKAEYVRISGISLDVFVSENLNAVIKAAKKGTRFDFVVASKDANFLDEIAVHTTNQHKKEDFVNDIEKMKNRLINLDKDVRKNINIWSTDSVLYASVLQVSFRCKTSVHDYMAILFYAFGTSSGESLSVEISRGTSPKTFEFYENVEKNRLKICEDKDFKINLVKDV